MRKVYSIYLGRIALVCRLTLSAAFLYAGVTKLADPVDFAIIIDGYGLLPELFVFPVAIILPIIECIAAVGILFQLRISMYAMTAMLVLFIAVLMYGIRLGLDIDCGCFGPDDPEQAYHDLRIALLRDIIFLMQIVFLFWWQSKKRNTVLINP